MEHVWPKDKNWDKEIPRNSWPLVSTLLDLVSTHCPKIAQKVVMRNQRSRMGQGKSDEHPPYE
ncbi:hypothetical protein Taro_024051 [Colocasia esculenta]|uniref:Uncharacterized protein n=1 Tax=Colocasia esculenta TaxID=4460 RepID=A0A843V5D5_COLES|nr:hypothetical protein [Colocasia esculenta]